MGLHYDDPIDRLCRLYGIGDPEPRKGNRKPGVWCCDVCSAPIRVSFTPEGKGLYECTCTDRRERALAKLRAA